MPSALTPWWKPAALQFPGAAHDTTVMVTWPKLVLGPVMRFGRPHTPLTWLTTSPPPAAPQLPADGHETWPTVLIPGIRCARPHLPLTSLTMNACGTQQDSPFGTPYEPPTLQLPRDGHATELIVASWPVLSAARPRTCRAAPQVPLT